MDKKAFFKNFKRDANRALSMIIDKVEKVSKVSTLRLKISNYKGKIKDNKTAIGELIVVNKKKFSEFPEIIELVDKITFIEKQIELIREQIKVIQAKEQNEEKVKEEEEISSK